MKSPILSCAIVLVLSLGALSVDAGSATWNLNPTSGDWNTAANWTPPTVPNGPADTATFDLSNTTAVSLSADTEVDSVRFDPGASAFTVTVPVSLTLSISGNGLTNNSATMQNFVTAADATGLGTIQFSQNASAGSLTVITNNGLTSFTGTASAGAGTFVNNGEVSGTPVIAQTEFSDDSSAGSGTFINNGGAFFFGDGGQTDFFDSATADDGTFIVNGGTADGAFGGLIQFFGNSTAGSGTFTVNGPSASGAFGGIVYFYDTASAGEGTFTLNDGASLIFTAASASTAANATLIANGGPSGGGTIVFTGASTGGTARVQVFESGELDISFHDQPGVTIGSLEGDGQVLLGSHQLKVGTNNLSTTFSGVIQDRGSLSKLGTGALTLSGNNTYGSGTMISAGVLKVNNETGSGTGTGVVNVNAGTLGGKGTVAGAVTVGTGSGAGAFLEPSIGVLKTTSLSVQSALTLKADSTYTYKLNTRRAKADKVIANGVTIESGAQFNFVAAGNKTLTLGKKFVAISNTAATPISGTFANLPDGSTFTVGPNSFQVSYSGGDGNDLTLTVVP
jgi:autotransporter-associated beta strand protein